MSFLPTPTLTFGAPQPAPKGLEKLAFEAHAN